MALIPETPRLFAGSCKLAYGSSLSAAIDFSPGGSVS